MALGSVLFIAVITVCPEEVDEDWWPFTPAGVTVTVSCGVDFVGNLT